MPQPRIPCVPCGKSHWNVERSQACAQRRAEASLRSQREAEQDRRTEEARFEALGGTA